MHLCGNLNMDLWLLTFSAVEIPFNEMREQLRFQARVES